jgi:hypothetical protein
VHPTSGTLRVFKLFSWLEVGSAKISLSQPAHPPVTQAVGLFTIVLITLSMVGSFPSSIGIPKDPYELRGM